MGTTSHQDVQARQDQEWQLHTRLLTISEALAHQSTAAVHHSGAESTHQELVRSATEARDQLNVLLSLEGAADITTVVASHERRFAEVADELLGLGRNIQAYLGVDGVNSVQLPGAPA